MSCHGCTKKYSFFNKEKDCPNCGFSYCGNCLKFKAIIPKLGRTQHNVCRSCDTALSTILAKQEHPEYPAASLQRLESLENPAKPPITFYQRDQKMQRLKSGLTESETELANRLEKLREGRKSEQLPSEDDIAYRLALLKGEDPSREAMARPMLKPDLRSEQQQIDDLMNQYHEERELEAKLPSPTDEIANRLAELRGISSQAEAGSSSAKVPDPYTLAEEDSSEEMPLVDEANLLLEQLKKHNLSEIGMAAEKCIKDARTQLALTHQEKKEDAFAESELGSEENEVIERVLAKAALEEKLALAELSDDSAPHSDNEELPWCVICNKDAKKKCEGCSGDIYCNSCFMEFHADDDMKTHTFIAFKPSNKNK